jgi:hypothetical protein
MPVLKSAQHFSSVGGFRSNIEASRLSTSETWSTSRAYSSPPCSATTGHAGLPWRRGRQAQPFAQIDRGDDTAAQVQTAGYFPGCKRDACDRLLAQNIAHRKDRHAAKLLAHSQRDQNLIVFLGDGGVGPLQNFGGHGWSLSIDQA